MSGSGGATLAAMIMTLSCVIVLMGWLIGAALVTVFLNRRLARIETEHLEGPAEAHDWALLLYALCIFFWPAGFALGLYFFQKPETARLGRNCLLCGLADITVVVLGTTAVMAVVAWVLPGALPI